MRKIVLSMVSLVLATAPASAQETRPWAEKLFEYRTEHNFGTVARGSQLAHQFTFKNIYQVPLDITISRISCGCVTATTSTKTISKGETGAIDVKMDATPFTGVRTVRIYVTFNHPQYYSTAELKVTANSRQDVVFNPGQVSFGVVPQGQTPRQAIDVEYAGTLNWQITEAVANGLPVQVAARRKQTPRPGEVAYEVTVTLKPEAPPGALKGEILLKTNDPVSPLVPVLVEANVQAALTVAPSSLRRTVRAGEEQTVSVIVRGNKAFRVLSVDGQGDGITLDTPPPVAASPSHRLTFHLRGTAAGTFRRTLQIRTDLQPTPVTVTVEMNVAP
jgi:hypothetical protein